MTYRCDSQRPQPCYSLFTRLLKVLRECLIHATKVPRCPAPLLTKLPWEDLQLLIFYSTRQKATTSGAGTVLPTPSKKIKQYVTNGSTRWFLNQQSQNWSVGLRVCMHIVQSTHLLWHARLPVHHALLLDTMLVASYVLALVLHCTTLWPLRLVSLKQNTKS